MVQYGLIQPKLIACLSSSSFPLPFPVEIVSLTLELLCNPSAQKKWVLFPEGETELFLVFKHQDPSVYKYKLWSM